LDASRRSEHCSGETRLALHVPSSSGAWHSHHYQYINSNIDITIMWMHGKVNGKPVRLESVATLRTD